MMARAGRKRKQGPREANGQPLRTRAELRELAVQQVALAARARDMGLAPEAEDSLFRARSQMAGCAAGRAVLAHEDDPGRRADLWAAIQHMRLVVARHDHAIGAPRRHAVCLRLLVPADAMTADASSPAPDDRPPEVRARAASAALMVLHGWLGWTDRRAASEVWEVVVGDRSVRDVVGLLSGLACISDGIKGRSMTWRGRG